MTYKIDRKNTPNQMKGRNGHKPDMIVSHIMEGYYGTGIGWLCNPKAKASSHFVVSKKGEITQLVDIRDTAWANGTTVGKGNRNYANSTIQKARSRRTNANYFTISIEHEGFSHENQGALTPEQLKATIWLHNHIAKEVKIVYNIDLPIDRGHIIGHYQINPITKPNCPGKNFQFDKVIQGMRKGFVDVKIEKWQEDMGKKGIDNLVKKGLLNNPDKWEDKLAEPVPQYLLWSMLDRITDKE